MQRFFEAFQLKTIRKKMIAYFLVTTILMSFLTIYTFLISQRSISQMDEMFERNFYLIEISDKLSQAHDHLLNYLTIKNSGSLVTHLKYSDEIKTIIESTDHTLSYEPTQLLFVDIYNMFEEYFTYANDAANAKRGRDIDAVTKAYTNAAEIEGYIQEYISKIQLHQIEDNANRYQAIKSKVTELQKMNVILIVDVMLFSILVIIVLTYRMTEPIISLADSADEIAGGNFEVQEIVVDSQDEIKVLATAFNKMRDSIKRYIEELKNKAETETKLMDQELQNVKMQSLLNKAELDALQSQINPHFLFNTINTGVQLAMMEGADSTSEFLENMSKIFRYNIKNLKKPATLGEEIEHIRAYAKLLKVRFGNLLKFEFDIDPETIQTQMPPLILQPLVENACIHGLGGLEQGGKIKVTTIRQREYVVIFIEDNGIGMDQETILNALNPKDENEIFKKPEKSHTTGIGLANVIHRLKLYTSNKLIFEIKSEKMKGTKIMIYLPILEKEIQ